MELDKIDKNLLNIIQAEFPLSREPFVALGLILNTGSDEVIRRIEQLKTRGIIRFIGPVFNPKKLGYQTTLAAMKVPAERLNEAGQIISMHPMVSHCYERDHEFKLWFTLAMSGAKDIETEVRNLGSKVKAKAILNLPAVKTFKISTYFNLGGDNILEPSMTTHYSRLPDTDFSLSTIDRAVINESQQDLILIEKPFDQISARLSIKPEEFLSHCQALLQRGIMRRFSASISHNQLGFTANAMACWRVSSDMVETAGKIIAMFPEVSHCYERRTNSAWHYNLFAMIHAEAKETCRAIADKICSQTGLDRHELILLFSTSEIKKMRVRYTV